MGACRTGLERVLADPPDWLRDRPCALIAHPASVDRNLVHAADALAALPGVRLTALLGPEHGLRGEAQYMEAVGSDVDPATGLPAYSLYGDTVDSLTPSAEVLDAVEVVLVDLQDVGSRYYTFAATALYALRAGHRAGVELAVLDRPNPLGGTTVEGPGVAPSLRSFVGAADWAVRHGLTIAELLALEARREGLEDALRVVPMEGWRRADWYDTTGLPWVLPSPNMPTLDTAIVYPGGCLLEGTNLSEGRGTTRPFELVGAPWLDARRLAAELAAERLPGVGFRPAWFRPTFDKHAGERCAGVQLHVVDREAFLPLATGVALIAAARRQDPERFCWREDAYEFVADQLAIDLLAGSPSLRARIEADEPSSEIRASWRPEELAFEDERRGVALYGG